ncbi:MAG TPA: peptidase MA domain-containing protein [Dehalococcoidia bacterium]|nr:peptidase MA domain-containing protein [Dehalococcoidia bacterium]
MIRKTLLLAVTLGLLVSVLSPVKAQTEIEVPKASAYADFPYAINFNLSIESPVEINDVRLHYMVERESFAVVTSEAKIDIIPGTSVDAEWEWDMYKTGGMPPGTVVEYWWTITDALGNDYTTAIEQLSYDDDRYSWQYLTEGNISLRWYSGDEAFAGELMTAAQEAMIRLEENTGAVLEKPVRVYIYANSSDLQGAMLFAQEWTGGAAYVRESAIIIGISQNNIEWGKRAIVHELAHLVTHQMTSNPYSSIPTWLSEGISMYAEGEMEAVYDNYLSQAVAGDNLISVRTLCSPFSAFPSKSYLSYAQSLSLVEFLIESYGQEKMFQLLSIFKQGSTYDNAFMAVYDFDMDGLDSLWRDYIIAEYGS